MRHLCFSLGIWQGFLVMSGPIKSGQTQTWIPRAYRPVPDPRVCASGCVMHDCLHDAYRTFRKRSIKTQYNNLVKLNPTPREIWGMRGRALCLSQGLFLGPCWWVSWRVGRFPGANFTTPQAPWKTQTDLLPPPVLALGSSLAEGNALIKRGSGLTSSAQTGIYCRLHTTNGENRIYSETR